jgi:phosphoglycerate dehydrogenase-like enzyme
VNRAHPVRVLVVSGALAGAALDVAERRPADHRHPLLDLPNVVITPHIGGATHETLRRGAEMAAAEVALLVADEPPAHPLNPEIAKLKEAAS